MEKEGEGRKETVRRGRKDKKWKILNPSILMGLSGDEETGPRDTKTIWEKVPVHPRDHAYATMAK